MRTVAGEHFGFVVFEDKPVRSQRQIAPGLIEVAFYGGAGKRRVPESQWSTSSVHMLMPRRYGSRSLVLGQWPRYRPHAVALG